MSHIRQITKDPLKLNLKSFGFVLFLLPVVLPLLAYLLWELASGHAALPAILRSADLYAFLPLLILYLVIPLLDLIIGKDPNNPPIGRWELSFLGNMKQTLEGGFELIVEVVGSGKEALFLVRTKIFQCIWSQRVP